MFTPTPMKEKNTADRQFKRWHTLLPSSLPSFRHVANLSHGQDLFCTPKQNSSSSNRSNLVTHSKWASYLSSLTGRVGRHRPIPRHPCHHCQTRRALGPQPFSTFELFLVGGCLLFWEALYLEQYGTITQKNTVSQVSSKQIEQEA